MSKLPIIKLDEAFKHGSVPVFMDKVTPYDKVIEEYFLLLMCSPMIAPLWKHSKEECATYLGFKAIKMSSHLVVGRPEVSVARLSERDCLGSHLMQLIHGLSKGEYEFFEGMTAIIDTVATKVYMHSNHLENLH